MPTKELPESGRKKGVDPKSRKDYRPRRKVDLSSARDFADLINIWAMMPVTAAKIVGVPKAYALPAITSLAS